MSREDCRAEEWRDVPGWPNYQVSDQGRVRSRMDRYGPRDYWHILKPGIGTGRHKGHRYMLYGRPNGRKYFVVANLVLEAFVGPRPDGMWGLHKDDNQYNNVVSNLYWGTPTDNAADCLRNGNHVDNKGSKHGMAKLTEEKVREIRRLHREGRTGRYLAGHFGVSPMTVSMIVRRKYWRHVADE